MRLAERIVGKERPRVAGGRAYTPVKTSTFEAKVGWEFVRLYGKPRHEGPMGASLVFSGSQVDADNAAKSVLDALQGVAFLNDRQVHELHVIKRPEGPQEFTVKVWPL